jgi:hypothetical protein
MEGNSHGLCYSHIVCATRNRFFLYYSVWTMGLQKESSVENTVPKSLK